MTNRGEIELQKKYNYIYCYHDCHTELRSLRLLEVVEVSFQY